MAYRQKGKVIGTKRHIHGLFEVSVTRENDAVDDVFFFGFLFHSQLKSAERIVSKHGHDLKNIGHSIKNCPLFK